MQTQIVHAICIRAEDSGENDKICTLYTAQSGKRRVKLRGVKKAAARLKYAAQPFCFGAYTLQETKSGVALVTGCTPYESFFDLTADPMRYYAGSCMLESLSAIATEVSNPALFKYTVECLSELGFSESDPNAVCLFYQLGLLRLCGYGITAEDTCSYCHAPLDLTVRFYFDSLSFCCPLCGVGKHVEYDAYRTVRLVDTLSKENLKNFKLSKDGAEGALRLMGNIIYKITGVTLRALQTFLVMQA